MAMLNPSQIANPHQAIYDAYYRIVDPRQTGKVMANDAAAFLKKSGLGDNILGRIWDISDHGAKGYLDKNGLYVAMKLVAVAQCGGTVTPNQITVEFPPPRLGDLPSVPVSTPNAVISQPPKSKWAIRPEEKARYDQMFASSSPINGKVPGAMVKPIMMKSKLPVDVLGKLWDLADADKDGHLDRDEFHIAMHLIAKCVEGMPLPNSLPPELTKGAAVAQPMTSVPPIPGSGNVPVVKAAAGATLPWVVSAAEKARFDEMFKTADLDKDGFVSGAEIKGVFLQSGLPQAVLAHIWNLCDMKQTGKLNAEQFALALWLIGRKVAGMEVPAVLTPAMVPPTFRPKPIPGPMPLTNSLPHPAHGHHPGPPHPPPPSAMPGGLLDLNSEAVAAVPAPTPYSNPELEMLSKEIEELMKEKRQLEADVVQKEADIKIRNGEVRSLQTELDTLTNALKQLENQKGMAQKRLDDLDSQKTSVESSIDELKRQIEEERGQVEKLQQQADEQEAELKQQEEELFSKKSELDKLRGEECKLEEAVSNQRARRDAQVKELADTRLELAKVKHEVDRLLADGEKLNAAVGKFDSALEKGDVLGLTEVALEDITPMLATPEILTKEEGEEQAEPLNDDPFKNQDPFAHHNGFDGDGGHVDSHDVFGAEDPFKGVDPFGGDPFQSRPAGSGFEASTTMAVDGSQSGFFRDPFAVGDGNEDPFGGAGAALNHPESPSPIPPPKKGGGPPPRPAPPKNAPGRPPPPKASPAPSSVPPPHPQPPSSSFDPFAPSANADDASGPGWNANFADFSAFDQAFSSANESDDGGWASAWGSEKPKVNGVTKSSNWDFNLDSDPFFTPGSGSGSGTVTAQPSAPPPHAFSEDDQVAWAKFDSIKIDRQRRDMAKREEDELQMAINLSLNEVKKHGEAGPI